MSFKVKACAPALAVACVLSAACMNWAAHESNPRMGSSAADALPRLDRMFVENAVVSGRREVEHGRIAEDKAASAEVKSFATRLAADHTAANEELAAMLERRGIVLIDWPAPDAKENDRGLWNERTVATNMGVAPTGAASATGTTGAMGTVATTGEALDRKRAGMTFPWLHHSGAEFDAGYLAEQVKAHQDAIGLYSQQTNAGADPELKAFAAKQLPVLRDHLRVAQELHRATRH